jgi:mannitol/fructose-specific phosphotransferase system IIA component (Ntr-type)
VGTRTVASEVAVLNQTLGRAASVRLAEGRYRLMVVDAVAYRTVRDRLTGEQGSFNEPARRCAYIVARLAQSLVPVRTEELALEMSVGRSTVSADVAQLRPMLAQSDVAIEGRPHVGLSMQGQELAIRTVILRHAYEAAYDTYRIGPELERAFNDTADEFGIEVSQRHTLMRWFTVMLDRTINGHPLTEVPDSYRAVEGSQAHAFGVSLADRVAPLIGGELPSAESVFLALPVAGRRTPTTPDLIEGAGSPLDVGALVTTIFERIDTTMNVSLDLASSEVVSDFAKHVGYMINRLRYSLFVEGAVDLDELRERYPVASRMAQVAREVITEETGLIMDDSELTLAATYFQVFLEEHVARQHRPFRVAIITPQGPGAARLIRAQLAPVLPPDTRYDVLPITSVQPETDDADLVVTTPGSHLRLAVPTLELSEVFDRGELIRKLGAMRFANHGPLAVSGESGSMLVSLLDEDRFLTLPTGAAYSDAVGRLTGRLRELGMVNEAFLVALAEREALAPMQINDEVAFPHASAAGLAGVACAIGVIPRGDTEPGLRVVFLMAVPDKADYDDRILLRAYDEIIRLSQDAALVRKVSRLNSHVQFFYLMEDYSEATNRGRK